MIVLVDGGAPTAQSDEDGIVVVTKAGACAMTLAAPERGR